MDNDFHIEMPDGIMDSSSEIVALDAQSGWAEGVVYIPSRDSVRWSDIYGDRVLEHDLKSGETTLYRGHAGFTNGRTLDRDGSIIQCSHGHRRIERDTDGEVEVLVDEYHGVRFNSPNDVIVASDGSIWFSDPPYGILFPREGYPGRREYGDSWVFRYDTSTRSVEPLITDVEEPNGLAMSADCSRLYVADSSRLRGRRGHPGNHHVRVYDVVDGRCKNGRTLIVVENGVPDGIRVDCEDRIWVACGDGIHVFDREGMELGSILLSKVAANLCFGGRDGKSLYIAASDTIYGVQTLTTDATFVGRQDS